jgi:hypothetical protein
MIAFTEQGLSRRAHDESIYHGNDLAEAALAAFVAAKAKKKGSE